MVTTWIAPRHPGHDGWMALHPSRSMLCVFWCLLGFLRLKWERLEEDGNCDGMIPVVHQQKHNVIAIGKYFKVFQPFKMKQNLSLQNVSSSHCSSSTCLFQGKQIHFDLNWLMLIPAQNQPFLPYILS